MLEEVVMIPAEKLSAAVAAHHCNTLRLLLKLPMPR